MRITQGRKRDAVALSVSAIALLLYCFPRLALLGDVVFCRDAGRMHFPVKVFLAERLRAGQLPLWYPYDGLGAPFIENAVTALFHPFTAFSLLLSPTAVITASVLCCIVVALAGTYWLARRLGAQPAGAACAAIGFAASGTLVSTVDNLTFLCGACAFPVWLAALHSAIFDRRLRSVALASGAFAFAVLAGDFQAGYLYALTAPALMLLIGAHPVRAVATCLASAAAGTLLSSAQLWPTLSLVSQTQRLEGIPLREALTWSFPPLRVPELFIGDIIQYEPFHRVGTPQLVELTGYGNRTPWYSSVYLGIFAALGGILAIALGKSITPPSPGSPFDPQMRSTRRIALGLVAVAAVLLWLALGSHAALYGFFYRFMPLWRSFRYPEKTLNYVSALLAAAAGLGISAALREPHKAWKIALGVSAPLLLLRVAVGFLGAEIGDLTLRVAHLDPTAAHAMGLEYASRLGDGAVRAGALLLLAAALLFSYTASPRLRPYVPILFAAACLIDVGAVNSRALAMCTGEPATLQAESQSARRLQQLGEPVPGHFRVASHAGVAITSNPGRDAIGATSYRSMVAWDLQALGPNFSGLFHIETTQPYLPGLSKRQFELFRDSSWRTRWSPLFNGRFEVASLRTATTDSDHELIATYPEHQLSLSRVKRALPRAFIAVPTFVSSEQAARTQLSSPEVLSGHTAIFEQAAQPGYEEGHGSAEIASYEPERVVIRARLDRPGALVLNDSFSPQWTARLNGKPLPVSRANYLVRGVLLPSGEHEVVFRYEMPTAVVAGACLSIASLLTIAALAGWNFRRAEPTRQRRG